MIQQAKVFAAKPEPHDTGACARANIQMCTHARAHAHTLIKNFKN